MNEHEALIGKRALITGGAKRLGRGIATTLAQAGTHVAVHYNTSFEPAEAVCRELRGMGVTAIALQADLSESESVEPLLLAALEGLGGLDFLINNASIFPAGRLDDMQLPDLFRNLQVNAWAPFALTRAFWREIRGNEREGAVVNLLDTRLVGGDLAHAPYHLSKSLLKELTILTALEFAPVLRVNGVAPGAVLPPEELDESYLEGLAHDLPLKRRGHPEDIAQAVLYLLGASFVTGQVIFVDGGRHIRLGGSS